jgi:LacI family transcriptional regulator
LATGIKQIAEMAGVSVTTVSHVVNGTRFVSEEKRERVLRTMRRLHYRPNRLASGLRRRKSSTIGVVLPDITNPYFAEIARGVEDACFEREYSVIICNSDASLKIEAHYLSMLAEKQMDGIVLINVGDHGQKPPGSIARDIPFVMLDREVHGMNTDSIQVDNFAGGRMAADHLFALGHRTVACIGGAPEVYPSWDRVDGFVQYMRDAGHPVPSRMILAGDFQAESGYVTTCRVMRAKKRPTAIFAANDLMACGAVRALTEMGLCVPADVSVVGFDDITLSGLFNPPLTTIHQPRLEMGGTAVALLLERAARPGLKPRRVMLPLRLVARQSSGPAEGA